MSKLEIAIILGSARPGRKGKLVADWVIEQAKARTAADYELIDLADHPLPHVDEVTPPSIGQYAGEHTGFVSYGSLGGSRAIEHLRAACIPGG